MILSSIEQIKSCIKQHQNGEHYALYSGFMLKSVFQPIFNADKNIIGLEALLRICDAQGNAIRPDLFFHTKTYSTKTKIAVEALSRAIHILNFAQSKYNEKKLFLNVLPEPSQNLLHTQERTELLSHLNELNLKSNQIVMEFVELEVQDCRLLSRVKTLLHQSGCAIAVDDYGTQASNQERVALLNPEILKIDRSLLNDFMAGVVDPLQSALKVAAEVGAQTVIEGIESSEQFQRMVALDIDMFQGYHLAEPKPLNSKNSTPYAAESLLA